MWANSGCKKYVQEYAIQAIYKKAKKSNIELKQIKLKYNLCKKDYKT